MSGEADSQSLMPTQEVTRVETKSENAPAVSITGDNYLVAGPIPFRYMAPPLSMKYDTQRGTVLRTFKIHPDQSVLLTPHLRHSRFWQLSNFKITFTPIANKLNTSGRICAYYVANPYTANSLSTQHEIHRALTAERRWEMDCQTELIVDLDLGKHMKNCCITPELFFHQLGTLRVVCLSPPQSDACPTWQVVIEGSGSFYGIDSFDNRLFTTAPLYDLKPFVSSDSGSNVIGISLEPGTVNTYRAGVLIRKRIRVPIVFKSTHTIPKDAQLEVQLSKRMEITYSPQLATHDPDANDMLPSHHRRLYSMITTKLRYTSATMVVDSILRHEGADGITISDDAKFSEVKKHGVITPVHFGYLFVDYDMEQDVSVLVSLPPQEARIIMSGPWLA